MKEIIEKVIKKGKEVNMIISHKTKFIDSARFMEHLFISKSCCQLCEKID